MSYRIVPTPALVNPSAASLSLRVFFIDPDAAPGTFKSTTACTVTITDEAGTVIVGPVSATSTGTSTTYVAAMPVGLVVGKVYRVTWLPTISGETSRPINTPLTVAGFEYEDCPISSLDVIASHPTMTTFPASQVSWEPQIETAWVGVLSRLARTDAARRALWDVTQLYSVTLYGALGVAFRQAATFTGGPAIDMAREYERLARDEWESLTLRYDTDGDGDIDTQQPPGQSAYPPGPKGRR